MKEYDVKIIDEHQRINITADEVEHKTINGIPFIVFTRNSGNEMMFNANRVEFVNCFKKWDEIKKAWVAI